MSRLVWQQTADVRAAGAIKQEDDYGAKIAKYVPAEVVAFYIGVDKIVTGLPNSGGFTVTPRIQFIASAALFVLAWAGTPLYLARQAESGQDWVAHVTISTVAFPIWAYAVQGTVFTDPAYTGIYNAGIAGILVAVFTFASGLFPFKWPKSGSGSSNSATASSGGNRKP